MTLIVRPALSILVGLALTLYGVFHAIIRYPGSAAFAQIREGLPALGHVALFVLGIAAALSGLFLLVRNLKQLRYGWRHLQRITRQPAYAGDDPEWSRYR